MGLRSSFRGLLRSSRLLCLSIACGFGIPFASNVLLGEFFVERDCPIITNFKFFRCYKGVLNASAWVSIIALGVPSE